MRYWTQIPNYLTLLRIVMVVPLVFFFYLDPWPWRWVCIGLFALASITDWLDGFLARKYGLTSPLGALLDPIADKVLVAAVILLSISELQSIWFTLLGSIVILREIMVPGMRAYLAERGYASPLTSSFLAKLKTALQQFSLGFILAQNLDVVPAWIGLGLFSMAAALTTWTLIGYIKTILPTLEQ